MIRTLLAGAACAALLAACQQERSPEVVDKAQDMAAAPVGQVSAATMGANTQAGYISNAAMGDMYEIMAADIALERTQNAQVRELAQMIKTDHTAASNAMKALLPQAAPDAQVPNALDERRQGMIDNLRSASAENFDRTWVDQQVAAHQEAVTLHGGFQDQDSPLAAHARSVLPKIQAHLERAQQVQSAM